VGTERNGDRERRDEQREHEHPPVRARRERAARTESDARSARGAASGSAVAREKMDVWYRNRVPNGHEADASHGGAETARAGSRSAREDVVPAKSG
jgi:hypothetical protein